MSTWNELKEKVFHSKRIKDLNSKQKAKLNSELARAKIAYENGIDLLNKFDKLKNKIKTNYVIPYVLEYTEKITEGTPEHIQVKEGSSGGRITCHSL